MLDNNNNNLISDCLHGVDSVNDQHQREADELVSCQNFELRINNLMDNRASLASDHSLQDHAEGCLSCQQALQQYQQLELLLVGKRENIDTADKVCLADNRIDVAGHIGSRFEENPKAAFGWGNSPLAIIAMLVVLITCGLYFNDAANVEFATDVATVEKSQAPTTNHLVTPLASSDANNNTSPTSNNADDTLPWTPEFSVQQLMGLVDSGSELLAAGEQQVSVIRELSDVKFDLSGLENQLESLQPVLSLSGRIPALTPMQGTVCFTLGWLKTSRGDSQQDSNEPTTEVGMQLLLKKNLA